MPLQLHYVKSVQIRSFFWSGVFSRIRTEYGYLSVFSTVKYSYFISLKVLSNVHSLEQVTRLSVPATIQFFMRMQCNLVAWNYYSWDRLLFPCNKVAFFWEEIALHMTSFCTFVLSHLFCFILYICHCGSGPFNISIAW